MNIVFKVVNLKGITLVLALVLSFFSQSCSVTCYSIKGRRSPYSIKGRRSPTSKLELIDLGEDLS